jgi:hypothetical protein
MQQSTRGCSITRMGRDRWILRRGGRRGTRRDRGDRHFVGEPGPRRRVRAPVDGVSSSDAVIETVDSCHRGSPSLLWGRVQDANLRTTRARHFLTRTGRTAPTLSAYDLCRRFLIGCHFFGELPVQRIDIASAIRTHTGSRDTGAVRRPGRGIGGGSGQPHPKSSAIRRRTERASSAGRRLDG